MKEMDRIESAMQLQSLLRVRAEAVPIICRVSQAEGSGKWELKFEAFWEALGKLPLILEHLKGAPQFEGDNRKELSKIQQLEEKALEAYIESCEMNAEQLKDPNRFRQSKIVLKVSRANGYWDASARKAITLLRK